jgi:hypothetical protein
VIATATPIQAKDPTAAACSVYRKRDAAVMATLPDGSAPALPCARIRRLPSACSCSSSASLRPRPDNHDPAASQARKRTFRAGSPWSSHVCVCAESTLSYVNKFYMPRVYKSNMSYEIKFIVRDFTQSYDFNSFFLPLHLSHRARISSWTS